ncbi:hypothetical protein, partial [Methylibium petroleiphilum]
ARHLIGQPRQEGIGRTLTVHAALGRAHWRKPFTLLVHTGLPGAASIAVDWALQFGVEQEAFRVFDELGDRAEADRNARMVAARADGVIAFPGDRSTADLCMRASAAGIPIWYPYGS